MNSKLIFFSNFIEKPNEVASIIPCSKYVINHIIKNIDFKNAKCIVEYGSGVGNLTAVLLKRLNPDAKLLCFEINRKFCNFLENNIEDPRFKVIYDTAKNLDFYLEEFDISNVDYVISSIPFSLINKRDKHDILQKTKNSLKKNGKFIVYQNSRHMMKYLNNYFNKISTSLELRNIPPTFIFVCERIKYQRTEKEQITQDTCGFKFETK